MNAMINHAAPFVVTGRIQQPISIMRLLEWAFADECASVDFEDAGTLARGYPSIGTEWLMMETARLGCRVDGGGRSDPDPDADMVASAVSVLPEGCGGRAMAVEIAELARGRRAPDCMIDVRTKCVPVEWRGSKHGPRAKIEVIGHRASRGASVPIEVCPVTYHPSASVIARARRCYLDWYGAMLELRSTFQIRPDLSRWRVTDEMPVMLPWQNKC
jgi:hypothetical protein